MRKMGKNQWIKGMLFTLAFTLGIFTWTSDSVVSLAAGNAKVKASSAMIRKDADKSSDVVASVLKGDSLDVISSKKASDGQTWYKVYVDGEKTGYIRSDLVTVDEKVICDFPHNHILSITFPKELLTEGASGNIILICGLQLDGNQIAGFKDGF